MGATVSRLCGGNRYQWTNHENQLIYLTEYGIATVTYNLSVRDGPPYKTGHMTLNWKGGHFVGKATLTTRGYVTFHSGRLFLASSENAEVYYLFQEMDQNKYHGRKCTCDKEWTGEFTLVPSELEKILSHGASEVV